MTLPARTDVAPVMEEFDLTIGNTFTSTIGAWEPGDIEVQYIAENGAEPIALRPTSGVPALGGYRITNFVRGTGFEITVNPALNGGFLNLLNRLDFSQPFQFAGSGAYQGQRVEDAVDRLALLARHAESIETAETLGDGVVEPDNLDTTTPGNPARFRNAIQAAEDGTEYSGFGALAPVGGATASVS